MEIAISPGLVAELYRRTYKMNSYGRVCKDLVDDAG